MKIPKTPDSIDSGSTGSGSTDSTDFIPFITVELRLDDAVELEQVLGGQLPRVAVAVGASLALLSYRSSRLELLDLGRQKKAEGKLDELKLVRRLSRVEHHVVAATIDLAERAQRDEVCDPTVAEQILEHRDALLGELAYCRAALGLEPMTFEHEPEDPDQQVDPGQQDQ